MHAGLKRDKCLEITGLGKNQLYHVSNGNKPGRRPSSTTRWRDPSTLEEYDVDNTEVVNKIVEIKLDEDLPNWYRMITTTLQLRGYYINHKKVYRLMWEHLLLEKAREKQGRDFVKFRRVCPLKPLTIIEMDIKYIWIDEVGRYAFILTILDTFTRYVLHWEVGYTMKSEQVKASWEYIIANYFQQADFGNEPIAIEVRNDNGKQFASKVIMDFFEENHLNQVFTHPYTPEENGHVESFHKTLGKALEKERFTTLQQAESRLEKFYISYNNHRSHGSLKGLPPAIFWALFEMGKIKVIPSEKRRIRFGLDIPYQDVLALPGIDRHEYRAI